MKSHRLILFISPPGSRILSSHMKTILLFGLYSISGFLQSVCGQGDVTRPTDPVIGGQLIGGVFTPATQGTPVGNANMFPASGKPSFAIDDALQLSYRNFGELNTGLVISPAVNRPNGGTILIKLILTTAFDSPERDPLTFTLEGTNGDPLLGSYTLIASGSTGLDVDPGRGVSVLSQTFAPVGAATSYRLIFPTIRDSATADSMQIGEVQLIGTAAPEPSATALLVLSAISAGAFWRRRPKKAT